MHGIGGKSMAIDSQWADVILLLQLSDDLLDAKSHTVTAVGGASLSSAVGNPFGAGNALYLDGVNDYLSLSDSTDWDLSNVDFTAEVWLRTVSHGSNFVLIGQRDSSTVNHSFTLEYSTTLGLMFRYTTDGTTLVTVDRSWTPTDGVWYHAAVIRTGTVLHLKIDGSQIGSDYTIGSATIFNSTSNLRIGATNTTPAGLMNGYIGGVRLTKSSRTITAAPTTPFPRPTIKGVVLNASAAPVAKTILVSDRSTQRFLGGANSDATTGIYEFRPPDFGECAVARLDELCDPMTDECVFDLDPATGIPGAALNADNKLHSLTFNGNAKISSDGGSFEFDGSGDCIQSASNFYVLALEDFDISFEFMPINGGRLSASYNRLFAIGADGSVGSLNINCTATSNQTTILCEFYDTAYRSIGSSGATTYANYTWHKLRLRRVSGVFYLEMNGTLVSTSAALAYNITQTALYVGAGSASYFYGNIGKVRISKGPRRAAASISNALLLTGPADGGSGENAIIYDRVIPGG